jgi:transposase
MLAHPAAFFTPYSPNLNPIERLWKRMKREAVNSRYTVSLGEFRQRMLDFFAHISKYKDKLASLINTNFQTLKPATLGLQYPL